MANDLLKDVKTLIVNTGNTLSLNDITKNPAQNPAEELAEAIKLTITDYDLDKAEANHVKVITNKHNDLEAKMAEHEIANLKIGIKVFLNSDNSDYLLEALDNAFKALNVSSVHNVIISLNHKGSADEQEAIIGNLWTSLERLVTDKKIQQIGLSDLDEPVFRNVHQSATIKPSIIQINLSTCCVVPPTLQQFCKDNEILLLTHSDPVEILSTSSISNIFGESLNLNWVVRFLVHIQCRGVLTTKGYIISLDK